jgi:hypothetical protein
MDINATLVELHQNIGHKDTIELLEFALPRISQRGNDLQKCLLAKDWDSAAKIAHQTLSSARLYSSSQFELQLQHIHNKEIELIDTALFQQEFHDEVEKVKQAIRSWLDKQSAA